MSKLLTSVLGLGKSSHPSVISTLICNAPKRIIDSVQAKSMHTTAFNMVHLTQRFNAEPLKAKRRVDPAVLLARENRKKKRLEKEIKKMEKLGRVLKPIDERDPDRLVLKEANERKRAVKELSKNELDDEYFLKKEWANFVSQQHLNQMAQIGRALKSQNKALKELRHDNYMLYNMAIKLDDNLVPYNRDGPVHTPPMAMYEAPEGDYYDATNYYERRNT